MKTHPQSKEVKVKAWAQVSSDGSIYHAGLIKDMEPQQMFVFKTKVRENLIPITIAYTLPIKKV